MSLGMPSEYCILFCLCFVLCLVDIDRAHCVPQSGEQSIHRCDHSAHHSLQLLGSNNPLPPS